MRSSVVGSYYNGSEAYILDQILVSRGLLKGSPLKIISDSAEVIRLPAMEQGKKKKPHRFGRPSRGNLELDGCPKTVWTLFVILASLLWPACYKVRNSEPIDTDTDAGADSDTDTSPHRGKYFRDIMGTGPNDIYASGTCGLLLHFDGESWEEVNLGVEDNLNAVWAVTPDNVLIGGKRHEEDDDECQGGETDALDNGKGIIYRFDGTDWQVVFEREEEDSQIESLWGSSPENIYAVGGKHHLDLGQSGINHFDGISWTTIPQENINWECNPNNELYDPIKINGFGPDGFYLTECYFGLEDAWAFDRN